MKKNDEIYNAIKGEAQIQKKICDSAKRFEEGWSNVSYVASNNEETFQFDKGEMHKALLLAGLKSITQDDKWIIHGHAIGETANYEKAFVIIKAGKIKRL